MEKSSISVSATSATNVKKIYRIKVIPQQAIRDQCLAVARGEAQSDEILPTLWFPSEDALRTVTNNTQHPLYALVMEALASDSPEGGSFSDEELKILKRLEPGTLEPIEDMEKQLQHEAEHYPDKDFLGDEHESLQADRVNQRHRR